MSTEFGVAVAAIVTVGIVAVLGILTVSIMRLEQRVERVECAAAQGGYGQQSSVGPITIRYGRVTTGRTTPTVTGCK